MNTFYRVIRVGHKERSTIEVDPDGRVVAALPDLQFAIGWELAKVEAKAKARGFVLQRMLTGKRSRHFTLQSTAKEE
jgi:hypothetical protein